MHADWPCPAVLALGDTGNAQHRTDQSFSNTGSLHWKSPFLVLFAERSLEVAPNKFLPHFLLGHNLEVIWREEAISREAFELWALVLWHFFTLPG